MSNPYRVHPTRFRADPSLTGSTVQTQKPWNPNFVQNPPNIDSNTTFQSTPIANQTKPKDDTWDWNIDNSNNGNDSWNWSIEQTETQAHQQQRHQQQQQQSTLNHTIPPYSSKNESTPPAVQENFYKNLNGNNKIVNTFNQHGSSGKEIPRAVSTSIGEPIQKQPNSFSQYTNYTHNPQFTTPPPLNSSASYSESTEQLQWSSEQSNQNFSHILPNQIQSQKSQIHPTPQLPTTSVNNYNWNNVDQTTTSHDWHNHVDTPTSRYWDEVTPGKQDQFLQNVNKPWLQQSQQISHQPQQRIANVYPQSNANSEQSKFYNPHESSQENTSQNWLSQNTLTSSQWPKSNSENVANVLPRQQSLPSNTHSQAEEASSLSSWQQTGTSRNISNNHWRQPKLQPGGSLEESALSENSKSEWQQIHAPPSHFNSSTTSTTSGSLANMSSSTEQLEDRKRSLTPTTSYNSLNDFQTQTVNTNQTSIENNVTPNLDTFQSHNKLNLDWSTDRDWNTVNEISNDVHNLSLNSQFNHQVESTFSNKKEVPIVHGVNDWGRQAASIVNSDNTEFKTDIIPTLTSETNIFENSNAVSQEQFDIPQASVSKSTENVSQTNYDHWYKQNIREQPENEFFNKDRGNSVKKWPVEQNVENYENIQQSSEFVNLEVVAPEIQEKDIYGSHDSINKETLDNDQVLRQASTSKEALIRDFRQEVNNIEVPAVQQIQQPHQSEQAPDNYEFASNDRNTFLETGELTDPHSQEHEPIPPTQDDENDEVPNDIPFLREVPGQSSSIDLRRNDPTGQEQYLQGVGVNSSLGSRIIDPRRNDPSGQEQHAPQIRTERTTDRRDLPSGQERINSIQQQPRNSELEIIERRNDPSGHERSLPSLPQQSRNDPSGEEQRAISTIISTNQLESGAVREIPGRGNEINESGIRQIPGGASSSESVQIMPDDRTGRARVVTGSQEVNIPTSLNVTQDASNDNITKREEAVGASLGETPIGSGPLNRRDSYEDGDDEESGNSIDGRDRRRESSPKPRHLRYDYNRKPTYYDRERDYDDDYYYDRRRGADYDRHYTSREDLDRRDTSYRDDDRRHASRDDLDRDRHPREDLDRRSRLKEEIDERDGRRRIEERRHDRSADPRRLDRENREFDPRYPRDRDFLDRERDRRRDDRRSRRYPEYDLRDPRETYRRDYYEDAYGRSSRPSSRSSYNDRDRDYFTRSRDPYSYGFNNYQGYDYGTNYNSNYYAYLENLRRTDPAAYAEWYHKYYQTQNQIGRGAVTSNYPEDRASVHSGRSSCDDRNSSDKRNLTDVSLQEDQTTVSSRLTPTKFSTAHTKGIFSIDSLIHVHASYPTDGERARVDILKMDHLLPHDATLRELRYYPGPLIKGVTHKKTIIEYCENKIKKASVNDDIIEVSSYVLLYELMIMLIQQNGNVVGVDIASLLLRNKETYPYEVNKASRENIRRESTISQRSGNSGEIKSTNDIVQLNDRDDHKPRKTVEQLTDEFRNTLLYGLIQEALEFAMIEGLWGHALFLASKLDKRTHASVMARFANSLSPQDPLQTLYQLHSGRVPASVTCVSDSKWDDWRHHLAMIISNTSANPDVNRRSISTLGDTLATRGDIYAAHFCYILSQVDFGTYGGNNVKLVLIGANHHKPYFEFISTEAIMLTEIYEYARKLSEPFNLVELQTFKFNMAIKMVDYGLVERALLYIEQIAGNIVCEPEKYKQSFINDIYVLGDRLKYHDPICKDSDEDVANLPWLNSLAEIVGKCEKGEIVELNDNNPQNSLTVDSNMESAEIQQEHKWNSLQVELNDNSVPLSTIADVDSQMPWQSKQQTGDTYDNYIHTGDAEYNDETANEVQQHYQSYQQNYWSTTQQQQQQQQQQMYDQQDYSSRDYSQTEWHKAGNIQYVPDHQNLDHSEHQNNWAYEQQQQQQQQQQQRQPNISMGPSGGKQYDPLEELESLESSRLSSSKSAADMKKQSEKTIDKKQANAGGSWFGGLFSKLTPKPKNQMILPDDSDPSIVWDPVAKKWMNKEEEDGGGSTVLAPPPKISEITSMPVTTPVSAAPIPTAISNQQTDEKLGMNNSKIITGGGNIYKLSRSRNMRANYVDVMNPGGTKTNSAAATPAPTLSVPTPAGSPAMPIAASSPQLFIPVPASDPNAPVDFLTQPTMPQINENSQAGPMMFNPVDFKDRSQKNQARSRYPPR